MIKLDELKPILEPLLEGREDAADIIESITAIDVEVVDNSEEIARINKEWNDRYMKAFFSGVEETDVEPTGETVEEEVEEKTTFEELFKED